MHSCRHFPELPGKIKDEKFNIEDKGCVEVNVGIPAVEVLITLVRLKRYDWP